jgi:hypothetical protein
MALAGGFVGGWFGLQSTDKTVRAQAASQERETQRIRAEALLDTRKKVYEEYINNTNESAREINDLAVCTLSKRAQGMRDVGSILLACGYSNATLAGKAKATAASDLLFIYGSENAIIRASKLDVARLNMHSAVVLQKRIGPTQLAFNEAKDDFLIAACVDVNPAAVTACR